MRPRVLCNMAASIDGKIAPSRRDGPFVMSRHSADSHRMRALRAAVDAVIIGAGNLRADDPDLAPARLRVVVTTSGEGLDDAVRFFARPGDVANPSEVPQDSHETIVAHDTTMPPERRARLAQRATLVDRGASGSPAATIEGLLAWLASERRCETVLCEGGAVLLAAFFEARAIDELHLTLAPRILGGGQAPTIVSGDGFAVDAVPDARLVKVDRVGDELFVEYAFLWA